MSNFKQCRLDCLLTDCLLSSQATPNSGVLELPEGVSHAASPVINTGFLTLISKDLLTLLPP
ncbi:hypothetical protein BU16DRAFT_521270 [Lophium mytilinum]|uniref:Uncharacterized protein n=1 Tax=Lophium mytilinum TaxID=390894 RepID=A0A6A6RCZ0_9PEZI|nr:hypothetical protein BU16DRAFT_521270 [Lophium mytilinum]